MKEITIQDIIKLILKKGAIIALCTCVIVAGAALTNYFILPNKYTAGTTLYVLNQQKEDTISSADLSASALLVNDYRELILSQKVQVATAEKLGLEDLEDYDIDVSAVSNTRMIKIAVTGLEAHMAANIANELAYQFAGSVVDIMRVDNVSIIDRAELPTKPSAPHRERNIALSGLVAAVMACGVVLLFEMLNTTLRTVGDIEEQLGLPVLAQVAKVKNTNGRKGLAKS